MITFRYLCIVQGFRDDGQQLVVLDGRFQDRIHADDGTIRIFKILQPVFIGREINAGDVDIWSEICLPAILPYTFI